MTVMVCFDFIQLFLLILIFCSKPCKAFTSTISTIRSRKGIYPGQKKSFSSIRRTFLAAKYRPDSNKPPPPKDNGGSSSNSGDKNERNWIEKSSPTGTNEEVEEYTLKLHGPTFQVGPLSLRIYDALMENAKKRFGGAERIPPDIIPIYQAYAMDMTCREATKAALKHNGLQLVEDDATKQSGMPGLWGEIDTLEIVSSSSSSSLTLREGENIMIPKKDDDIVATAESIQEAVAQGKWVPGQPFNFIVRNVKAKLPELSLKDLIKTLNMQDMAKEMGMENVDLEIGEDDDDDDDDYDDDEELEEEEDDTTKRSKMGYSYKEVKSLSELRQDLENRCNSVPTRAAAIGFAGGGVGQGYDIVSVNRLMIDSNKVCDSCKKHGFVVLDFCGGTEEEEALEEMWTTVNEFFTKLDKEKERTLPKMEVAADAGSKNALVGYVSYDNNAMQFLETRLLRTVNGQEKIIPDEFATIIGINGVECIKRAQHILLNTGRDVARIAVACSLKEKNEENGKEEEGDDLTPVLSGVTFDEGSLTSSISDEELLTSSTTIIDSLMDHGQTLPDEAAGTWVSMSPHRLCRYMHNGKNTTATATEVFGAHTDTSFVTIVPVAAVSGLEIYDNAAGTWVRPELMARLHWENEQLEQNKDPASLVGLNGKPWHARYVVCMSGELLELVTQSRFRTAVHRVVAACRGEPRASAPVLVRARPQASMDVKKLFGSNNPSDIGSLLASCDQLTMEKIHDCLQPPTS